MLNKNILKFILLSVLLVSFDSTKSFGEGNSGSRGCQQYLEDFSYQFDEITNIFVGELMEIPPPETKIETHVPAELVRYKILELILDKHITGSKMNIGSEIWVLHRRLSMVLDETSGLMKLPQGTFFVGARLIVMVKEVADKYSNNIVFAGLYKAMEDNSKNLKKVDSIIKCSE